MATLTEVSEVLAGAAAVYPNFKMAVGPDAFARAWHRHVGHLPAAQLQAAMDRAVHESEFFPTVHDVLKAHGKLGSQQVVGAEAWAELQRLIAEHGYYQPPYGARPHGIDNWLGGEHWTIPDPITARLVPSFGGWAAMCQSDDVMVDRAHFIKAYEAIQARQAEQARQLPAAPKQKELTP